MESYYTILEQAGGELSEKRSRFIGLVCPVVSEEEAAERLCAVRSEHRDASHHCYAYLLRQGKVRYSDDGEPQGTAGLPMLELLRREGVTDVMAVVTRYFGGTLLGTGGLVRAYSRAAGVALAAARRVQMCECAVFSLALPYPLYDRALKLLEGYPAQLLGTDFTDEVALRVRMRADRLDDFSAHITELSAGGAAPEGTLREFAALSGD